MSLVNAAIVNCHEAGIRKFPENPNRDKEVIGFVKAGAQVKVDTSKSTYTWNDKHLYWCESSIGAGWINEGVIQIQGGT